MNGSACTLHKLHFHSKAKINVGCSFLTFPLHKNLMGQSSTQPVDNQVESGEIVREIDSAFLLFLSPAQEDLELPIQSGCPGWVGKHRASLDTLPCTGGFQKRTAWGI